MVFPGWTSQSFGLPLNWVRLVMDYVSTISYSLMINGNQCGSIHPSRGLRQGDLLSPYLFIIVAEGLSCMLSLAESSGLI